MEEKKIKRKISWHLYFGAFVITALIFGAGFYIGSMMQKQVYNTMGEEVKTIENKMKDVELLLISEDTNYFCEIYQNKLPSLDEDTYNLGQKLEYMESEKGVSDPKMKKEYFELQLRDYILMMKAREKCNIDFPILIYFYHNPDCEECVNQGYEITKLRKEMNDKNILLRVYAFDGAMNDSIVVKMFIKEYNITKFPSTIIITTNKTTITEGFHDKEYLKTLLK
ncbi:hypothetical protein J7J90_04650 [Candidatus Micrarchaeota archaeon]|nr:hypothetical protein [Candidatus Micrarchaeota archaeon]